MSRLLVPLTTFYPGLFETVDTAKLKEAERRQSVEYHAVESQLSETGRKHLTDLDDATWHLAQMAAYTQVRHLLEHLGFLPWCMDHVALLTAIVDHLGDDHDEDKPCQCGCFP